MIKEEVNTEDKSDDVWVVFAELMNEIEVITNFFQTAVSPPTHEKQDEKFPLSVLPLPESLFLVGYMDNIAPETEPLFCSETFVNSNQVSCKVHI